MNIGSIIMDFMQPLSGSIIIDLMIGCGIGLAIGIVLWGLGVVSTD